ncbi:MAG: TlpA disulfide reductase family protein [candidate division Zixibacteria bacterium]
MVCISIACSCSGDTQSPKTKQQAEDRIVQLLATLDQNWDNDEYQLVLTNLEEMLALANRYSIRQDRILNWTDKKQFMLQKLGRYDEALTVAFELEELSQQLESRRSPWNYLKIADSYLGMQDLDSTIAWIEKAVYDRGFIKYRIFEDEKWEQLQSYDNFQKAIRHMKDIIGLQHPAKDFTVSLLDGEEFELSAKKGKVVLIDFWDVACPPCIRAMPELRELHNQYSEQGLVIIGISLDTDKELLRGFLEENDIPWKITCTYDGWKDATAILYGISSTPSTWLIDREGVLQYQNVSGEELKNAVEELI